MKPLAALGVLIALAIAPAPAAELAPFLTGQRLGVVIKAVKLPATLPKDLLSGLTNRLLMRVALVSQSQVLGQETAELDIKYDLWDEDFRLTLTVGDTVVVAKTCSSVQEVEAFVDDMRLPNLFARSEVPVGVRATLRVEMLLNPIEQERMAAIRRWVAENSTYTSADTEVFGSGKRVGSSRSNAIFDKIFEQYSGGAETAATWKETVSSKPFKIAEVANE